MKLCKICKSEITHNRKRLLCEVCLKEEQKEYYHFKKDIYNTTRKLKKKSSKCKVNFNHYGKVL